MATADRGGPFAHANGSARNWMRAAAPGIGFRHAPRRESSPIGRERKGIRRFRSWIGICVTALAVAGTASFGSGAYMHAKAGLAQWLLHAAWNESLGSGAAVKPWPWADTHPVARITAPRQDADVLVLAGASGRTLAFGPGHLDGSALPGDPGNAIVTAHRDTHFRFLRAIDPGDEVVVERAGGGRRHFRIRGAYVADHRNLRLPRDTAVPTLTLVTCYPFDAIDPGGPLRYVVVAEAV